MTLPKTRYPIESFGPELRELLLKGSIQRIELKGIKRRVGHRLQQRLNMLRSRMLALNHPDHKIVARARVSLIWGKRLDPDSTYGGKDMDQPAMLVVAPHDSDFTDIIKKAGVEVRDITTPPTAESEPAPPLTDLLDELELKK